MRHLQRWAAAFGWAALAGCSSTPATAPVDAGPEAQAGDSGLGVLPQTQACTGAAADCLSGTVTVTGFTAMPMGLQVNLYRVFPYGPGVPEQKQLVAADGTFAFSGLAAWAHYYVQAEAGFTGTGTAPNLVASNAGPFAVPVTGGSIAITVKPVFLEVFQQAPSGGATTVGWASAHVYHPVTGAELADATATFDVAGQTYAMPYVENPSGTKSYFAALPANVAGQTSFTITTVDSAAGLASKTWNLVGAPATFMGAVTQPSSTTVAKVGAPLPVTWQAAAAASYSIVELFFGTGSTPVYVSPAADAPDTTTETVPGTALAMAGMYLLNVVYSDATCPATADGCVYNDATVPVSFLAQ